MNNPDTTHESVQKDTVAGELLSLPFFTAALDLRKHPLLKAKAERRATYFSILEYFAKIYSTSNYYVNARLGFYRKAILRDAVAMKITPRNQNVVIRGMVNNWVKPWMNKYRYLLLCDLAQILIEELSIRYACDAIKTFLTKKQAMIMDDLQEALLTNQPFPFYPALIQNSILQYRANRSYITQRKQTCLVTANMSAGKSTLINALTGKTISCMKNEAFTADIHYIYSKPYEDGYTSEWDGVLTMEADDQILMDYDERNQTGKVFVATHFASITKAAAMRYCFIDTPGVNSAINREHGRLTRHALREEEYDRLIYIFNATRLGTDEEMRHLRFVADNVPHDKIIFVLNKIDNFNLKDDSIEASIEGIKKDLQAFGFNQPLICPISAYFALLIKKVLTGVVLSEDEQDAYELYRKKFSGKDFDLSRYYPASEKESNTDNEELIIAARKCGLIGLESILYRGENRE